MSRPATLFVWLTIALHLLFFLGEAVLWMTPAVYGFAIPKINPGLALSAVDQAQSLRALLINQGAYNLLLALGAAAGLVLVGRGRAEAGQTLVVFVCAFAVCAGLMLAATTQAFVAAALQILLSGLALALLARGGRARRRAA